MAQRRPYKPRSRSAEALSDADRGMGGARDYKARRARNSRRRRRYVPPPVRHHGGQGPEQA